MDVTVCDTLLFFFFKQKTAYEMRISDWSSDVCSSDLPFSEGSIASYTSEEALRVGIDRMAQDEWAQRSHDLYFAAEDRGFFAFERFAVPARTAAGATDRPLVERDESPRRDSSPDKLASLKTVRSEERSVGKEVVSKCRSRWSPDH